MGWEDRLLPLSLALPPVVPTANRWPQIQRAIAAMNESGTMLPGEARRPAGRGWWPAALAASLIAVALLIGKLTFWSAPTWQPVAVLAPANAAPLWRLERTADAGEIKVRAVDPVTVIAGKSYELWILPRGTGTPVSLGLLPNHGELKRRLTPAQSMLLRAALKVAVSVEPAGGSPTGVPTGPVVIVASVVQTT
jgi:anti-sigma-K factor RskA